jgi:hypothetical protein
MQLIDGQVSDITTRQGSKPVKAWHRSAGPSRPGRPIDAELMHDKLKNS